MIIYTIYKSTNTINGKVYIGFDSNYPSRIKDHKKSALKKGSDTYFHRAIRKYGWDNFTWEIIYQSVDGNHTLNVMEGYFITEHDTYYNGYNMTLGGEGSLGHKYTPTNESNILRSIKLKNRTFTEDHCNKIALSRKGTKFNKEWCDNISKARLGKKFKPLSDIHAKKISESNKKPKVRCSCISCHRELSVNALNGNHVC